MKNKSFIFDLILEFCFYLLVVFVPIAFTTVNFELFEFNKIVLTYLLTIVIIFCWLAKAIIEGKFEIRRSILDIPILLFLSSQVIATISSIDIHTSIFGYYSRFNGGLASLVCYIILYYALISNFGRQKIIQLLNVIILGGLIVSLWGIPSHFGFDPSCKLIVDAWTSSCWTIDFQPTLRIFSTIGQPNWLAAYLAMLIPASIALIFYYQNYIAKAYYLFVSIILFLAFILTYSRAASLGLGIALFLFALTIAMAGLKDKNLNQVIKTNLNWVFVLLTVASFGLVFLIYGGQLIGRVKLAQTAISSQSEAGLQAAASPSQTSLLAGGTESGKIRFIVWQGAYDIFKHYPVFGTGVETFGYSYYRFRLQEHNNTTEWNFLYNKAHNEYLNYLANTGLVGLAAYILLITTILVIAAFQFLSKQDFRDKILVCGLVAGYLANLILNFFGFSVVVTSILAYLYPGIMIAIWPKKAVFLNLKLPEFLKMAPVASLALAIILALSLLLAKQIKSYWQADVAFALGQGAESVGDLEMAEQKYKEAIILSPIMEPLIFSNLGAVSADLALEQEDQNLQQDYVQNADYATGVALKNNSVNPNFWRAATQTYLKLSLIEDGFINDALISAQSAVALAPTEPEILYHLALVQRTAGYTASASASLEKALELKQDFTRARDELEKLKQK